MVLHVVGVLLSLRPFVVATAKFPKKFMQEVKQYGFVGAVRNYLVMRESWHDKENHILVGTDKFGNKYWKTTKPVAVGRDRWIEYHSKREGIYDASDIPAEWHMWLHHIRDQPPTKEEMEGTDRAVHSNFFPNQTFDPQERYLPTGHMLSKRHKNAHGIQGVDPNEFLVGKQSTVKAIQIPSEKGVPVKAPGSD